ERYLGRNRGETAQLSFDSLVGSVELRRTGEFEEDDIMTQAHKTTTGEIFDVQDHGSIVLVFFLADDDKRVILIPFDHRPFSWLLQGEDCEASDLIGRRVEYDGETIIFQNEDEQ